MADLPVDGSPLQGPSSMTSLEAGLAILCALSAIASLALWRALVEARRQLATVEERFRYFTDRSHDWYWEQDASLRFTHMSATRVDLADFRAGRHIGLTRRESAPIEV